MDAAPTESELSDQLRRRGLEPIRWDNGPDAVYATHQYLRETIRRCHR